MAPTTPYLPDIPLFFQPDLHHVEDAFSLCLSMGRQSFLYACEKLSFVVEKHFAHQSNVFHCEVIDLLERALALFAYKFNADTECHTVLVQLFTDIDHQVFTHSQYELMLKMSAIQSLLKERPSADTVLDDPFSSLLFAPYFCALGSPISIQPGHDTKRLPSPSPSPLDFEQSALSNSPPDSSVAAPEIKILKHSSEQRSSSRRRAASQKSTATTGPEARGNMSPQKGPMPKRIASTRVLLQMPEPTGIRASLRSATHLRVASESVARSEKENESMP